MRGTLHLALARTYDSLSMWNEAEAQYLDAIDVDRAHRGPLAASTVEATMKLGGLYNRLGRYREAAELTEPLWRRLRRDVGVADARTLDAQLLWGHCMDWLGRSEESIEMLREVAELADRHFPEQPQMRFTPWTDIGVVYRNANRPEDAENHLRQILQKAHERLEPLHPLAVRVHMILAMVVEDQGRSTESEALLRDLVERLRAAGPEHELILGGRLNTLGVTLENQGRLDEALAMYHEALEILGRLVGPGSIQALFPRQNILDVLDRQGRYEEALELSEAWAQDVETLTGPWSTWTVRDRVRRAAMNLRLGRLQEGEALLAEVERKLSDDGNELDSVEERLARRSVGRPEVGAVRRLDAEESLAHFPPLRDGLEAVHIAGGARVDGRLLAEALLAGSGSQRIVAPALAELVIEGDRVAGVRLDGGDGSSETIEADAVVVAAGAWTNELLEPVGVAPLVDVEPQKGQIIHFGLEDDTSWWPVVLPTGPHYLLAFDDNRVVVGATREFDSGFDVRVTAAGQAEVLATALSVAPGLADATVLETRVGLRPLARGLPTIGAIPGIEGLLVGTGLGAGGLTMGPLFGRILADLVMGRTPTVDLGPFTPAS